MKRLLDVIAMLIGGWLGWIAGSPVSFFVAFLGSIVGTGVALYASRRLTRGLPG